MDETRRNEFTPFEISQTAHDIMRISEIPVSMETIRKYKRSLEGKKITNK